VDELKEAVGKFFVNRERQKQPGDVDLYPEVTRLGTDYLQVAEVMARMMQNRPKARQTRLEDTILLIEDASTSYAEELTKKYKQPAAVEMQPANAAGTTAMSPQLVKARHGFRTSGSLVLPLATAAQARSDAVPRGRTTAPSISKSARGAPAMSKWQQPSGGTAGAAAMAAQARLAEKGQARSQSQSFKGGHKRPRTSRHKDACGERSEDSDGTEEVDFEDAGCAGDVAVEVGDAMGGAVCAVEIKRGRSKWLWLRMRFANSDASFDEWVRADSVVGVAGRKPTTTQALPHLAPLLRAHGGQQPPVVDAPVTRYDCGACNLPHILVPEAWN
jgi:hypothetical protein